MPTQSISAETMEIGKKGGGKHWTSDEKAARIDAASALKRKKINIIAPDWLNSGALVVWKRIVDDAAELGNGELLDNLDANMLAIYSDILDKIQTMNKNIGSGKALDTDGDMKLLQGWYRIIANYSDKLGFTPQARARLVKKIADKKEGDKFGKDFD
jgi:P27 family predicted phage terminase small subunit